MDNATTVAVLGFLGTFLAAAIGAGVAIHTNRVEKRKTAEDTMEKVLKERLLLRDEQIEDLLEDNGRLKKANQQLKDDCRQIRQDLVEARHNVEARDRMIQKLRQQMAEESSS